MNVSAIPAGAIGAVPGKGGARSASDRATDAAAFGPVLAGALAAIFGASITTAERNRDT